MPGSAEFHGVLDPHSAFAKRGSVDLTIRVGLLSGYTASIKGAGIEPWWDIEHRKLSFGNSPVDTQKLGVVSAAVEAAPSHGTRRFPIVLAPKYVFVP